MKDYAWITNEKFDEKLNEILRSDLVVEGGMRPLYFLARISPNVYEDLVEHYNNDVLAALEQEHPIYYEDVYFAQEQMCEEEYAVLENNGPDALVSFFLTQAWIPGSHAVRSEDPSGDRDHRFRKIVDSRRDIVAILSWNEDLPYIGFVVQRREGL